jgi:hypothetical protein
VGDLSPALASQPPAPGLLRTANAAKRPNGLTSWPQVYVEGRLQTRGWEDETGKKHFRTELVANEMILLGDRRRDQHSMEIDYADEEGDDGDYAF